MGQVKREIIVDQKYRGINPMQFGYQQCDPCHSFGPSVRTHWLLHYVHRGSGIFTKEGKTHRVGAGDIFVIRPYEETYYRADREDPWHYIWIGFLAEGDLPAPLQEAVIHCPAAQIVFEDMIRCGKLENGRSAFLCAKLWELFSILLEGEPASADYVKMALSYMNAEYVSGITVTELARRLNLNRSYFSVLFRERMGVSPQEYLIRLRMQRAAELLTVYGETPATAGLSVGYADLSQFSRIFKRYFGLSPRHYQTRYRGGAEKP